MSNDGSYGDRRRWRTQPRFRRATVVAVIAVGAVVRPPAFVSTSGAVAGLARAADTDSERTARQHFRQGETHYAAGRYADALAAYQAGYAVEPLPGFLVNIAQCQRRLGDLERARASYGKFVLVAPDSPLAPEVRKLIEELDRLIAETAAADRTSSAAVVEGAVVRPVRPPVAASADIMPLGSPESGGVSQPGDHTGDGADLTMKLGATAVAAEPAGTERGESVSGGRRWWLWGAVSAAVVGAVIAGVVLSAPGADTIHEGSLGTLRR